MNDLTLMADMFNITMHIEQISEDFALNLPQLNMSSIDNFKDNIDLAVRSDPKTNQLLHDAVTAYRQLSSQLVPI